MEVPDFQRRGALHAAIDAQHRLAREPWRSFPSSWSVIGGSAALLLGVSADYALPVAGAALAVFELSGPLNTRASLRMPTRGLLYELPRWWRSGH
jgi:hypothetical protein